MNNLIRIFVAKGARVFVFGLVSIMTPVYVATLGYSPFYVGIALAAIIGGNIFSNILLTWYRNLIGVRRALLIFSLLMLASGFILFATTFFPLIIFACFIGNISATGTEAGPFQSIETGILPDYVAGRTGRAFGMYNVIGYSSQALGALAAGAPSLFQNGLAAFHYLYLIYGAVGLLLFIVYTSLQTSSQEAAFPPKNPESERAQLSQRARDDVTRLSVLYGIDALGGGFVSQYLLAYWFFLVYRVSLGGLAPIFFVVNIITALSILGAPFIAERIGNLRTMVFTHLLSNVFLVAIPLAGSLIPALAFLFLRQSVSQMDVPTRQTFMVEIFDRKERVPANAITNTSRSIASIFGAPVSGILLAASLDALPILAGGISKIVYDCAIFLAYRKRTK